ncbi:hypothetical protein OGAPHI_006958 [Ogataea philodendri]|uniref:Uncharacterized protein n=1 Tax=Ogataea philodendri TaxID=1378263 RepID=A0A9P8NWA0_9ASCO|nr:uncharacterized protein OGAPHI_006958 [Ogataea philodendri]KAH3660372.1 hypothetical protein OGAPHI_006958 [Ogataea philodendri]
MAELCLFVLGTVNPVVKSRSTARKTKMAPRGKLECDDSSTVGFSERASISLSRLTTASTTPVVESAVERFGDSRESNPTVAVMEPLETSELAVFGSMEWFRDQNKVFSARASSGRSLVATTLISKQKFRKLVSLNKTIWAGEKAVKTSLTLCGWVQKTDQNSSEGPMSVRGSVSLTNRSKRTDLASF